MNIVKRSNGFTLVEIIVSLLIASIVMIIAGSLILNSMGYFSKSAISDNDKQALDGISEYVTDELIYASDIRIVTEANHPDNLKEENWHWLYVKDGYLWRDADSGIKDDYQVYTDDYYYGRTLEFKTKGFDIYRLDLKFSLLDKENENVYKTTSTIELLNIKEQHAQKEDFNPFTDTKIRNLDSKKEGYRIYYKKGNIITEKKTESDVNGTVADQIGCMSEEEDFENNRGAYKVGAYYKAGDYVYFIVDGEKVYYRCLVPDDLKNKPYGSEYTQSDITGSSRLVWKKISAVHTTKSAYLIGDVVVNKLKDPTYYVCVKATYNLGRDIPITDTEFWEPLSAPPIYNGNYVSNKKCDITIRVGSSNKIAMVAEKADTIKYNPSAVTEKIEDILQELGGIRYIRWNDIQGKKHLWYKIFSVRGSIPLPGVRTSFVNDPTNELLNGFAWTKIQVDWSDDSAYAPSDVVWYNGDFYQLRDDNIGYLNNYSYDGSPPAHLDASGTWYANSGWRKVVIRTSYECGSDYTCSGGNWMEIN